jgi:DNA-binding GntR family transcriptional regulator
MPHPKKLLDSPGSPPPRTPSLPPIHHENLEDKIYDRLKAMITDRVFQPGERFLLSRLSRELGVSRTPLVNALKRLAQEQLVEWVSRRGIYVRRFTKREMADLYEVRVALEGLAARLAAERIDDAEIRRLEAMFGGVEASRSPAVLRSYTELDRQFHWRIVELSKNPQLINALNSIHMRTFAYQFGLARPMAESIKEHREMLKALRAHDGEKCERLMRRHHGLSVERLKREAEIEEKDGAVTSTRAPRPLPIDVAADKLTQLQGNQ